MPKSGHATKVQKVMVPPINVIFRYLQQKSRVSIWLYEQTEMRIEGYIIGFDEFMNLVLDDASEVQVKQKTKTGLGELAVLLWCRLLSFLGVDCPCSMSVSA